MFTWMEWKISTPVNAHIVNSGKERMGLGTISWDEIVQDANTGTNYQIFPGDRVFIGEDRSIAASNFMRKVQAPFETFFGFISLGSSAVRNLQNIGVRNGTSY